MSHRQPSSRTGPHGPSKSSSTGSSVRRSMASRSTGSSATGNGSTGTAAAAQPPPREYQRLSIVVFKGGLHDSYDNRHTALYIEHWTGPGSYAVNKVWRRNMIRILGDIGHWNYDESWDRDPTGSNLCTPLMFVKEWDVGAGTTGRADGNLRLEIMATTIRNDLRSEWTCQNWLHDALLRLRNRGRLTEAEQEAAWDRGINRCFDAPHQPLVQ